ncbi:hypothetical protein Nepgr_019478 [Nepenthes gracilis]|uniref:Uncharacterized protein n=1 Tax=Nepenthes gracilis TaxID=150966 RepID=A0AAD3XU65_NEPGR|nr:hypothetical protein Nepgr_019478 [Nepenthes gracilis]
MMLKERKGINPLLIKFGIALALSFAGFLYSRIRTKRIKPPQSRQSPPPLAPPPPPPPDYNKQFGSRSKAEIKDDSCGQRQQPRRHDLFTVTMAFLVTPSHLSPTAEEKWSAGRMRRKMDDQ